MISNGHGYFWRTRPGQPTGKDYTADQIHHDIMATNKARLRSEPFAGLPSQDAKDWWTTLQAWLALHEWNGKPHKVANGLRLLLVAPASTWLESLDAATKEDVKKLNAALREQYIDKQTGWML